jgi:hypothetical protein
MSKIENPKILLEKKMEFYIINPPNNLKNPTI